MVTYVDIVSGQGSDDSECPLVKSTPVPITNSTRCISPSSEYQVSVNSNTSEYVNAQTQYHRDQECNIMFQMESKAGMSPKSQFFRAYSSNINETSPALREDQENRVNLDQEKFTRGYNGEQEPPNNYIDENSIQAVEKTLARSQSQDIFESQVNLSPQRRFIESPFQPYDNNLPQKSDYVQRNPLQTVELHNSGPNQTKSHGKKRGLTESSAPSKRTKKESRKTLPNGYLSSIGAKLYEIASRRLSGVFDGKMPDPASTGSRESEPSRRKSWFEV